MKVVNNRLRNFYLRSNNLVPESVFLESFVQTGGAATLDFNSGLNMFRRLSGKGVNPLPGVYVAPPFLGVCIPCPALVLALIFPFRFCGVTSAGMLETP